jgi:hypothetical protein
LELESKEILKENIIRFFPFILMIFYLMGFIFPSLFRDIFFIIIITLVFGGLFIIIAYVFSQWILPFYLNIFKNELKENEKILSKLKKDVENNPISYDLLVKNDNSILNDEIYCLICQSKKLNFQYKKVICPFCETKFHKKHLESWFLRKSICPMCKKDLKKILRKNLIKTVV